MVEECEVCINKFNQTTRRMLCCPRCHFRACQSCVRKYILQSHYEVHCMNCKQPWDLFFLGDHFPQTFLKEEYKKHRAEVLFEQQRSLFPETIPLIQRDKEMERLEKKIEQLLFSRANIQKQIVASQRHLFYLRYSNESDNKSTIMKKKAWSTRSCTYHDCKGYLDESGVCGLCERCTCLNCNTPIGDENHECTQEEIANWNEIRRSTRPCPSCQVPIHRISGCNQMWCPQCKTAFDYVTGTIEKGPIHNPHYYEYMQAQPTVRAQEMMECVDMNNIPDIIWFSSYINRSLIFQTPVEKEKWIHYHRLVTHVQRVEMDRYNHHMDTLDLRKSYLRNEISEEMFKKRIQERDKRFRKCREMYAIWEMFVTISNDLLHDLFQHLRNKTLTLDHLEVKNVERDRLIRYVNDCIKRLNRNFQSRLPYIHPIYYTISGL